MDLTQKTEENMEFLIDQIKRKLKMASGAAMKAEHYDMEQYEDVKDIYEMVMDKNMFSIKEMEAIVSELGKLRRG